MNFLEDHIGPFVRGRRLLRGDVLVEGVRFDNMQSGSGQDAALDASSGG